MPLTYAFRLPPGPQALDHAILAEKLGYQHIWSPEIPAFGHDIWVHLARIAERTERIGIGPAVLTPSYRHPVAQASAIATPEHIAEHPYIVKYSKGMPGGKGNPMGARALYLYQGDVDTVIRIHGAYKPDLIGKRSTAGCISLINPDIVHLYDRVNLGTRVVILPAEV